MKIKTVAASLSLLLLVSCGSDSKDNSTQASNEAGVIANPPAAVTPSAPTRNEEVEQMPVLLSAFKTAPKINSVTFLEEGGRPEHTGLFPSQSEFQTTGASRVISTNILGEIASATYRLVAASGGRQLSTGPLVLGSTIGEYVSDVAIPSESFYVDISAKNQQRICPDLAISLALPGYRLHHEH